jgi:L-cysteate sulfo-lyase
MSDPRDQTQRIILGGWPTPVESAPRLAAAIGLGDADLWIKRDDLTGLGGGGNKVRKLEWTIGAAMAAGCDTLVTTGAPQSNHARLTAAAGARLGLNVVLVLSGEAAASHSGNLTLDALLGAHILWTGGSSTDQVVGEVVEQLRQQGRTPYVIPFGGSSALGARGYVEAGLELEAQLPGFETVITAVGSGGTMAGLVATLGPGRVLGVDTGAMEHPATAIARFATDAGHRTVVVEELRIRSDQVGAGYAALTDASHHALELAARTEGIILDPTYTARAMAGLIAAVEEGTVQPGSTTVFLHSGGVPGLFGHVDAIARLAAASH